MNELPIIQRNITIDEERFALVVTTHHVSAEAHDGDSQKRLQATHRRRSVCGGGRWPVRSGHLSSTMTEKCMAAMIPADGQKTVIVTGRHALTEEQRAEILVEHVRVVKELDPGVIVGPDMNNPESVQDRAARAGRTARPFYGPERSLSRSLHRHQRLYGFRVGCRGSRMHRRQLAPGSASQHRGIRRSWRSHGAAAGKLVSRWWP